MKQGSSESFDKLAKQLHTVRSFGGGSMDATVIPNQNTKA